MNGCSLTFRVDVFLSPYWLFHPSFALKPSRTAGIQVTLCLRPFTFLNIWSPSFYTTRVEPSAGREAAVGKESSLLRWQLLGLCHVLYLWRVRLKLERHVVFRAWLRGVGSEHLDPPLLLFFFPPPPQSFCGLWWARPLSSFSSSPGVCLKLASGVGVGGGQPDSLAPSSFGFMFWRRSCSLCWIFYEPLNRLWWNLKQTNKKKNIQ